MSSISSVPLLGTSTVIIFYFIMMKEAIDSHVVKINFLESWDSRRHKKSNFYRIIQSIFKHLFIIMTNLRKSSIKLCSSQVIFDRQDWEYQNVIILLIITQEIMISKELKHYKYIRTSENINKFITSVTLLTEMIYDFIGRTYRIVFCFISL